MALIRWTGRAQRDLRAIYDYIAVDNPVVAARVAGQLIASIEQLRQFPDSGRCIPRFEELDVREVVRPPYRVAYRHAGDEVRVLRVHHGARLLRPGDVIE